MSAEAAAVTAALMLATPSATAETATHLVVAAKPLAAPEPAPLSTDGASTDLAGGEQVKRYGKGIGDGAYSASSLEAGEMTILPVTVTVKSGPKSREQRAGGLIHAPLRAATKF